MGFNILGYMKRKKRGTTESAVEITKQSQSTSLQSDVPSHQNRLDSQEEALSNVKIFKELLDKLNTQVDEGLISSAILSLEKGTAIAEYNSNETTNLLLCSMTKFFMEEISHTSYMGRQINDYYTVDLKNNHLCLVLLLGEYCWYMVIDKKDMTIGMLLNVIAPGLIEEFQTAREAMRVLKVKEL